MPQCVDCGRETPREQMFGPPDELRCPECVQRRFPATNVPKPHRSSLFLRKPPVTLAVIITSVVVTLLYWSSVSAVKDWWFADLDQIWDHQLWRLLTSVFPHLHPLHLVFNLIWFWQFGKAIEQWMGSLRFAGFFIATAVGSLAAEVLTGGSGAGLSGVVYAQFGLLYALRNHEEFAAEQMTPSVVNTLVFWFFLCIVLTYTKILPVANVAHGAGAVLGWLFGWAVLNRQKVVAAVGVGLLCVALALATQYMPWNGLYAWHRADQCFQREDYACAMKWYELAAERLSGENQEKARHNVEASKHNLELQKQEGP